MENYKVKLTFKFEFDDFWHLYKCRCNPYSHSSRLDHFCNCYRKFEVFICKNIYSKFYEYNHENISKVIISSDFELFQFDRLNFLKKRYWNSYHEIFKENLPKIYLMLKNNYVKNSFMWELTFPISKYKITGKIKLDSVRLLKRSPKVIFKKVFANIVLRSLFDDIYKPGSKRFQKCQERFLENSNRIK